MQKKWRFLVCYKSLNNFSSEAKWILRSFIPMKFLMRLSIKLLLNHYSSKWHIFFSRLKADDNGKQALYCCIIENIGGIWGQAIKHNKAKNICVWLKDILQTNLLKSVQSRFQSGLKRFSKALSWLLGCAYSGRSGSIIWSFRVAGFFHSHQMYFVLSSPSSTLFIFFRFLFSVDV